MLGFPGDYVHGDRQPPQLDVTVHRHPAGYAEVVAAGEIDFATYQSLLDSLTGEIEHGSPRIVLDLGRVSFCDSTGIGVLVRAFRQATRHSGWLRVAAPRPGVRRALEITNIDRMIPIYDSVRDARRDP